MKLFGTSLSELLKIIFRADNYNITVQPNASTTYTADRTVSLPNQDADSELVSTNASQALINKTINAASNTVSNIDTTHLAAGVLDTDLSSVAGTDTTIPSALAVKTYVDAQVDTADDASEISYTPAVLTDWDADADPGSTAQALDQLAERVDDNEIAISANASSISGKQNTITGAATSITSSDLTVSRILQSDGSGKVAVVDTATYPSLTELSYVKNVTSALQTQLDAMVEKAGDTMTGHLNMDNQQAVRLMELDGNGANYIGLKAPDAVTASLDLKLPDGAGTNGYALTTDGVGQLAWSAVATVSNNQTRAESASYTITDIDNARTVLVTTAGTDRTITLPTAADNDYRIITIIKVDTGTGTCTVDGELAETINGKANVVLYAANDRITVQSDGTNWVVLESAWHPLDISSSFAVAGWTSLSSQKITMQRENSWMNVVGYFTGTTASANCSFTVPFGLNIGGPMAALAVARQHVGDVIFIRTGAGGTASSFVLFYDGSDTTKVFLAQNSGSSSLTKILGTDLGIGLIPFQFRIQIAEWT